MAISADSKMIGVDSFTPGYAGKTAATAVDTGATDRKPLRNIVSQAKVTAADGTDLGLLVVMIFPTETGTLNLANAAAWGLDQFAAGSLFLFPAIPATPLVVKTGAKGAAGYRSVAGTALA